MAKTHLRVLAIATIPLLLIPLAAKADGPVYSLSDLDQAHGEAASPEAVHELAPIVPGAESGVELVPEYPRQVSHHPGTPQKPRWDRPGDINQSQCPPERYLQDDCARAGWPHTVRKWATCSINPHYSAWYVGGGSACVFPHGRGRTLDEGTWGLDYSLWPRPGHVWMKWTRGREQGGLGAYDTDH
ncbi:MAG: hypothetical protein ACTHK7_16975 [Aureliella sp.]